jgi:hypothetical protein
MGISSFFGKGLASLIQGAQKEAYIPEARLSTDMERMFGNCTPAMVAFRINNGFVVRTVHPEEAYEGRRQGGFTYCKDAQEISEHIVASEARRKLGLQESADAQQDMFAMEKARAIAMQKPATQVVRRSTNF